MSRPSKFLLALVALAGLCLSAGAAAQRNYDPSGRVARISDMRGSLSYSPSGDGDWYDAHRNRPLLRGDALWSDRGARAEVQAGSVWLRMDGETSVEFLELNDRMLQVEVAEGTINVRVRRMFPGQRVEIDTPNLALVIDRPGNFRIDVDGDGNTTTIETREGIAMVYGTGGRFPVRRGDVIVFYGQDIRDYEMYAFPSQDNFDRYVRLRDQRIDRSVALRYLGDDLVGFADLDDNGRWTRYPGYGNVWFPTNVYAGWAPYQDGEWIWQEPWGWTWVDDEAWAFAPSHYGRWAWIDGRWGWLPGSRNTRSIYAPALVAFIEDVGGSIGWFPLGPGDIYYPTYSVSSRYFSSVNSANTPLAAANLQRAYSSYGRANSVPLPQMQGPATAQAQVQAAAPTQGGYRNRMAPGAVTVVRKDVFTNSRPVREAVQRGRERELLGRGELRRSLAARPEAAAIGADAPRARVRPPREVEDQQVFARNAPPAQQATPAPSAEAAAPAVRERPRRMRMLGEQTVGADVRATTAPQPAEAAAPAAAPAAGAAPAATAPAGQLRPLDREALPRSRRGRRFEEPREQPAPASVPAPAETPAPAAVEPARQDEARQEEARQAEQARAAAQTAREERRQAMEAQRKAAAEQEQAARAEAEAQRQREQARAQADAQQQREAVQAEAKAREERGQAQRAEQEAQRQQRESEQAQREAQKQQAEATQAADATPTTEAPKADAAATDDASADATETGRPNARRCYSAERIEEMRKGGVPEQRIAKLKLCPTEPAPTPEPAPTQQ